MGRVNGVSHYPPPSPGVFQHTLFCGMPQGKRPIEHPIFREVSAASVSSLILVILDSESCRDRDLTIASELHERRSSPYSVRVPFSRARSCRAFATGSTSICAVLAVSALAVIMVRRRG